MHLLSLLPLALGAAAAVLSRDTCTLTLSVSGSITATVGQRDNGQAIAGESLQAAQFTLTGDTLYDAQGRGCWWTPPSTVLQCDVNQVPDAGWTIGCDGSVTYGSQTVFHQCTAEADTQNIYNIYTTPPDGAYGCGEVTLTAAGGCVPACPQPEDDSDTYTTCPRLTLDQGTYDFPHLIIPIAEAAATQAYPTSYNGNIGPGESTIFNFDVNPDFEGKQCSLVFLFPTQDKLETSSFTFGGSGQLQFSMLDGYAVEGTTAWGNAPAIKQNYGVTTVAPGNSYSISTFDCPAGQTVSYRIDTPEGADTCLWWFEDYNPSPIGLYITAC